MEQNYDSSKLFGVALVGKGYWGSKIRRYVEANHNLDLRVVCDSRSDLETEVFGNPDIDSVIVAAPNQMHYPLARAALVNGKQVMCEKPLALTSQECSDLEVLAAKQDLVLCTDYTHTFSRSLNKAKESVECGEIGDIYAIDLQMRQLGRFGRGNVYWLLGSHLLAVLDMFVQLDELTFERYDKMAHGKEVETGTIRFYNDSIKGDISVSLNCPVKERSVVIYGQKGSISYNPLSEHPLHIVRFTRNSASNKRSSSDYKIFNFDESNNIRNAVNYFCNVMLGQLESNIKRASRVTQVLEGLNV